MKTVSVGSILGSKVSTVTTQATNVSPMATLVSGVSAAKTTTGSSLVNQFPAVRPTGIAALTKTTTMTPTTTTNTDAVTSTTAPLTETSEQKPAEVTKVDSTTNEADEIKEEQDDVSNLLKSTESLDMPISTTDIKEEPKDEDVLKTTAGIGTIDKDELPTEVPMEEAPPKTDLTETKDEVSSSTEGAEPTDNKMEVDQDEKPATNPTENSGEAEVKQEQPDQSSESVAASTLAQLASIASDGGNTGAVTAPITDMNNPLSTLAALASSSPIATAPVVNGSSKAISVAAAAKKVVRGKGPDGIKKNPAPWYDVAMTTNTSIVVSHYYVPVEAGDDNHDNVVPEGQYKGMRKVELQPGTAFKFRVAGINVCGRGLYSDIAAFKTCVPGFPGAPCSIKITKNDVGAHLSWEPPTNSAGKILEYAVYLAVDNKKGKEVTQTQLTFVRVYCGSTSSCTVTSETLKSAHIDFTTKPAIIFRIAAKNEKGYGPATQVRWLQDLKDLPENKLKRMAEARNDAAKRAKLS